MSKGSKKLHSDFVKLLYETRQREVELCIKIDRLEKAYGSLWSNVREGVVDNVIEFPDTEKLVA